MSRRCDLTGKVAMTGNRVSHANNKVSVVNYPNLQEKRIYVPELGAFVRLKLSTRAIRTIQKCGGLINALKKADAATMSPELKKILAQVKKRQAKVTL